MEKRSFGEIVFAPFSLFRPAGSPAGILFSPAGILFHILDRNLQGLKSDTQRDTHKICSEGLKCVEKSTAQKQHASQLMSALNRTVRLLVCSFDEPCDLSLAIQRVARSVYNHLNPLKLAERGELEICGKEVFW